MPLHSAIDQSSIRHAHSAFAVIVAALMQDAASGYCPALGLQGQ